VSPSVKPIWQALYPLFFYKGNFLVKLHFLGAICGVKRFNLVKLGNGGMRSLENNG
jgi:hypothetical protein